MPLQRRLPKRGFVSPTRGLVAEVRLSDLERLGADVVDIDALRAAGVVSRFALAAKVILSGKISRAVTCNGLSATKGALAAITAVGGAVNAPAPKADKPNAKASAKAKTAMKG